MKLSIGVVLCLGALAPSLSLYAGEDAESYIANVSTEANIQGLERVRKLPCQVHTSKVDFS